MKEFFSNLSVGWWIAIIAAAVVLLTLLIVMLVINAVIFTIPNVDLDDKFGTNVVVYLLFMVFVWAATISGVIK